MNPIVKLIYADQNGVLHLIETDAQSSLDSTDPADFGLPKTHRVIAVFHRAQWLACWLQGKATN